MKFLSLSKELKFFIALTSALFLINNITLFKLAHDTYWFVNKPFFFIAIAILFLTQLIFITALNLLIPTFWLLIFLFFSASVFSFFNQSYMTVFDTVMWQNVFETNMGEAIDLLSPKLFIYILVLALPFIYILISKKSIFEKSFKDRLKSRLFIISASILLVLIAGFIFSKDTYSFIREHKIIRYYQNPSYPLFNLFKQGFMSLAPKKAYKEKAQYAKISLENEHKKELIVFVVGETARYDHMTINGYERLTTPHLLNTERLLNYSHVTSCGTSTAISVPCMFSLADSSKFKKENVLYEQNALDVAAKAGVDVYWLDNNSDSKHVADRIFYKSFKSKQTNTVCDIECRDVGMIPELETILNQSHKKDVLVVMHQMGSHGPAYFKRYPKEFEHFKPACQSEELAKCSDEEIINAYDNSILYTDFFLKSLIEKLKTYQSNYEVTMIYISDHGESLGEGNVYLHGLPMAIAPESQKHVPMIIWASESSDILYEPSKKLVDREYTHNNVSNLIMRILEIESDVYKEIQPLVVLE